MNVITVITCTLPPYRQHNYLYLLMQHRQLWYICPIIRCMHALCLNWPTYLDCYVSFSPLCLPESTQSFAWIISFYILFAYGYLFFYIPYSKNIGSKKLWRIWQITTIRQVFSPILTISVTFPMQMDFNSSNFFTAKVFYYTVCNMVSICSCMNSIILYNIQNVMICSVIININIFTCVLNITQPILIVMFACIHTKAPYPFNRYIERGDTDSVHYGDDTDMYVYFTLCHSVDYIYS